MILALLLAACPEPTGNAPAVVGAAPAVWHDDARDVTCWTVGGGVAVSCLPDSALTARVERKSLEVRK